MNLNQSLQKQIVFWNKLWSKLKLLLNLVFVFDGFNATVIAIEKIVPLDMDTLILIQLSKSVKTVIIVKDGQNSSVNLDTNKIPIYNLSFV